MKIRYLATGLFLTATLICVANAAFWRFEDGKAGEAADAVMSTGASAELTGTAGVYRKGKPPLYDTEVAHAQLWDTTSAAPLVSANAMSLRFRATEDASGGAPVGGEVVLSGDAAAVCPESFTIEAFIRIDSHVPRHALIASKRRNGQSGATWSLSLSPSGALHLRFDTQQGEGDEQVGQFNQGFGGSQVPDDGTWHHVALTYDGQNRQTGLYLDYRRCGGGTVAAPLVYDDSDFVIGRGLNAWLDEVRLTPEVLHEEQFLRPTRFYSDMKPKKAPSIPLLDQTHTRVQTSLEPDLRRIGTLIPKSLDEIETSRWSLGCETLDRDLADWDAYKPYLRPLGIRRIRLQGGWGRTEKEKGVYDFAWLDRVVDEAHELGLEVCMETSYGNRIYQPGAGLGPGGTMPQGEETLAAWDRWVEAMVKRYEPRGVKIWTMYNEPHPGKGYTLEGIADFNIRTAEVIKRVDPEAKIGGVVCAGINVAMIETFLKRTHELGKTELFNWVIYHAYSGNPDSLNDRVERVKELIRQYAPHIEPWQGEAGCASEEVQYALSGINWTELSQAKWNARRMLSDLGHDAISAVFTISDLSYHKDFISRYGLLKTNPDNSLIKVKTAYYVVQNVVDIFNDSLQRLPDFEMEIECEKPLTSYAYCDKETGLSVVTFWDGSEIPTNHTCEVVEATLSLTDAKLNEPVWVDMLTGNVYQIAPEQITVEGNTTRLQGIPAYDAPAVITDKSLLKIEPAREKRK